MPKQSKYINCSITSCSNTCDQIVFHKIPSSEKRRKIWLDKCFGTDCYISRNKVLYVCGKHFTDDDYTESFTYGELIQSSKKRTLKPSAVPSVGITNCETPKLQTIISVKNIQQLTPQEISPEDFEKLPLLTASGEKLRKLREGQKRIAELLKQNEELFKCPVHQKNLPNCSIENCVLKPRRRRRIGEFPAFDSLLGNTQDQLQELQPKRSRDNNDVNLSHLNVDQEFIVKYDYDEDDIVTLDENDVEYEYEYEDVPNEIDDNIIEENNTSNSVSTDIKDFFTNYSIDSEDDYNQIDNNPNPTQSNNTLFINQQLSSKTTIEIVNNINEKSNNSIQNTNDTHIINLNNKQISIQKCIKNNNDKIDCKLNNKVSSNLIESVDCKFNKVSNPISSNTAEETNENFILKRKNNDYEFYYKNHSVGESSEIVTSEVRNINTSEVSKNFDSEIVEVYSHSNPICDSNKNSVSGPNQKSKLLPKLDDSVNKVNINVEKNKVLATVKKIDRLINENHILLNNFNYNNKSNNSCSSLSEFILEQPIVSTSTSKEQVSPNSNLLVQCKNLVFKPSTKENQNKQIPIKDNVQNIFPYNKHNNVDYIDLPPLVPFKSKDQPIGPVKLNSNQLTVSVKPKNQIIKPVTLTDHVKRIEESNSKLEKTNKINLNKAYENKEIIDKLVLRLNEVLRENGQLKTTVEEQKQENRQLKSTVEEQKQENHLLKSTVEEQKRENHQLNSIIDEQNQENHQLKTTVEEQKRENHQLNSIIDEQKQENQELKSTIEEQKQENITESFVSDEVIDKFKQNLKSSVISTQEINTEHKIRNDQVYLKHTHIESEENNLDIIREESCDLIENNNKSAERFTELLENQIEIEQIS